MKLSDLIEKDFISYEIKMEYNNYLIEFVFSEDLFESSEKDNVISLLEKNKLETTPKEFKKSLSKSKHKKMLTNYSIGELDKMKLFKVPNYNIGYALKKWKNGKYSEIVAVHNNEPEIKGVGDALMKSAIRNGGCYLDHFASEKLSNLYSKMGFMEYERDKYDPKYDKDGSFKNKYGKLDVIYRVHRKCKKI